MRAVALSIAILIGSYTQFYAPNDGECDMPVIDYTTGERSDDPDQLYSDSVEWVIESWHPLSRSNGMPGEPEGWIVLVETVADGDKDLNDFVMHPDGLAQVKFDEKWILQADFERKLCGLNT